MTLPRTSQQKSARTWWGYHRLITRRELWMTRGWYAATLAGLAMMTAWWLAPRQGASPALEVWASPGQLAEVHQAWNHDCEACHQPYRPIKANRDAAAVVGETVSKDLLQMTSANQKCQNCHAAPSHHSNQRSVDAGNCADCHSDHQGTMNSLVRLDDSKCISCHADLKNHAIDKKALRDSVAHIREFGSQHPEFTNTPFPAPQAQETSAAARHRRGLKFSHAVHMLPGMGLARINPQSGESTAGGAFTYAQIQNDAQRKAYQDRHHNAAESSIVQLICNDCHQLDSLRNADDPISALSDARLPRDAMSPLRGDGRYYLPIVFEKHCQSCHPLGFDAQQPDVQVDHRLQPKDVQSRVLAHFSERFLKESLEERLRRPANLRLDPLRELLTPEEKAKIAEQARVATAQSQKDLYALLHWANPVATDLVDKAAIQLFAGRTTCGECHSGTGTMSAEGIPERIASPAIPTIWQPKARFDHVAHQGLSCEACHPHSSNTNLAEERQRARQFAGTDDPLAIYQHPPDLPTLESCRSCHSSRPTFSPAWTTSEVRGGVAQRCTDCHTYHNTQHGLQGRGARTLSPEATQPSFREFLHPAKGWGLEKRP